MALTVEDLVKHAESLKASRGDASASSKDASMEQLRAAEEAYKRADQDYLGYASKGLASNIAGTVSFVPDALGAAYNLVAPEGYEVGNLYNYLTTEVVDAQPDPTMSEGEKAAYYGAQGVPVGGIPSMLRASVARGGVKGAKDTAAQLGTDVALGYVSGRVGEDNPWLGITLGLAGGAAQARMSPFATQVDKPSTKEAPKLAAEFKNAYGISETKGMTAYRQAWSMPEGLDKEKALAEAYRLVLAETHGRRAFDTTLDALNATQWAVADSKRIDEVEAAIRATAGMSDKLVSTRDLSTVRDSVYNLYKGWNNQRYKEFSDANEADFAPVRNVKFSTEPTARVLISMQDDIDLSDQNKAIIKSQLSRFATPEFDEAGNIVNYTFKTMNGETVKDLMSVYSKMRFGKGTNLGDMPKGKATFYGAQLLAAMDKTLDEVPEAGEQLRKARSNFSERLRAIEETANTNLVRFFEDAPTANPNQLADIIIQESSDSTQMMLLKSVLQGKDDKGKLIDPTLYNDVREQVFRRMFTEKELGRGQISLGNVAKNIGDLKNNTFFFDEQVKLTASQKLFEELDSILVGMSGQIAQQVDQKDLGYLQGKMGAEALGAIAGAKGRYVGELGVKITLFQKLLRPSVESLAKMANDPASTRQLVNYLKQDKYPTTAQIQAARNVGLFEWASKAGQINSIFSQNKQREETSNKPLQVEVNRGMFSQ